ncbi:hypothetical protein C8R46DRAFT_470078 [Mycena filopes]|nr:hypothetical protein C8R46DRAFT_470078 [Mycena filopes]
MDEQTGLTLNLRLSEHPPLVTVGQDYGQHIKDVNEPFILLNSSQFLDYIGPYTGPVERFNDPDHHIAIYYTLAGGLQRHYTEPHQYKVLLTTILDLTSRHTFVLVHHCPQQGSLGVHSDPKVNFANLVPMQDTEVIMAQLQGAVSSKHGMLQTEQFTAIDRHSRRIADLIGGVDRPTNLYLSWALRELPVSSKISTPQKLGIDKTSSMRMPVDWEEMGMGMAVELVTHDTRSEAQADDMLLEPPAESMLTGLDQEYIGLQHYVRQWRSDFYRVKNLHIIATVVSAVDFNHPPSTDDFTGFIAAMELLLVSEIWL